MPSFKALAAAIFVPGLAIVGFTQPAAAQESQCRVTIDRTQSAGTYDVTRQVFEDGNCICYVYTGPKPQADSIESAISELLNSKACPEARVQQMSGPIPAAAATAATAGTAAATAGGAGAGLGVAAPIAGVAAAAAVVVASDDDDDDNSSSP